MDGLLSITITKLWIHVHVSFVSFLLSSLQANPANSSSNVNRAKLAFRLVKMRHAKPICYLVLCVSDMSVFEKQQVKMVGHNAR